MERFKAVERLILTLPQHTYIILGRQNVSGANERDRTLVRASSHNQQPAHVGERGTMEHIMESWRTRTAKGTLHLWASEGLFLQVDDSIRKYIGIQMMRKQVGYAECQIIIQ